MSLGRSVAMSMPSIRILPVETLTSWRREFARVVLPLFGAGELVFVLTCGLLGTVNIPSSATADCNLGASFDVQFKTLYNGRQRAPATFVSRLVKLYLDSSEHSRMRDSDVLKLNRSF